MLYLCSRCFYSFYVPNGLLGGFRMTTALARGKSLPPLDLSTVPHCCFLLFVSLPLYEIEVSVEPSGRDCIPRGSNIAAPLKWTVPRTTTWVWISLKSI